jgi:hypothetical protein
MLPAPEASLFGPRNASCRECRRSYGVDKAIGGAELMLMFVASRPFLMSKERTADGSEAASVRTD